MAIEHYFVVNYCIYIKYAVAEKELEYDHLDYSRPGNSFKPHYHRMTNSLKKDSNINDLNINDTSKPSEKDVTEKNINVGAPVAQPESISDDDNKLDDEPEN